MLDKAENTNFEADRRTACDGQNQQLNLFLMVIFFHHDYLRTVFVLSRLYLYVVHVLE